MVKFDEDGMAGESDSTKAYRLFLLRVWQEDGRWQGRLLNLASGEACSFAGWQELIDAMDAFHEPQPPAL